MEIIYKSTKLKSNFTYCSELYKGKERLIAFDRLIEPVSVDEIEVENVKFDKPINGTLYLCYPLSVVVKEDIKFDSLHSLISEIRRTYSEVYKNRKSMISCGVWGHDIYDLTLSGIEIYKDGSVNVSIDS